MGTFLPDAAWAFGTLFDADFAFAWFLEKQIMLFLPFSLQHLKLIEERALPC